MSTKSKALTRALRDQIIEAVCDKAFDTAKAEAAKAVKAFYYEAQRATLPSEVVAMFRSYPDYVNASNYVRVHWADGNYGYEEMTNPLPTTGEALRLTAEQTALGRKLEAQQRSIRAESNNLAREMHQLVHSVRTVKQLRDVMPELNPLLDEILQIEPEKNLPIAAGQLAELSLKLTTLGVLEAKAA